MLLFLDVNFLFIDMVLTEYPSSSAAEEVKACVPAATSTTRHQQFLCYDNIKARVFSSMFDQSSVRESQFERVVNNLVKKYYTEIISFFVLMSAS